MASTSILGNSVLRREDDALLRGEGLYVSNRKLDDPLHLFFVRSTVARARITELDVSEAKSMPGVFDVWTFADLNADPLAPNPPFFPAETARPLLADGVVRFVGEPIAMILARSIYRAADAAETVIVDYDFEEAVVEMAAAADGDPIFEGIDSNAVFALPADHEPDFGACEVVVEQEIVNQRVAPAPIEPRTASAEVIEGRLHFYASAQGTHPAKDSIMALLDLPAEKVRTIVADVGGGFGAKGGNSPEELLVALVAHRLDRPVAWEETRSENLTNMGHGRAQIQTVKIGGDREGNITAYRLGVLQDSGAYPGIGGVLPIFTQMMLSATYSCRNVGFDSTSVVTNTTPVGAYRGAGRPEATAAFERAIDLFANELDLDPVKVRRKNLLTSEAFPYETPTGRTYDSGDYIAALDMLIAEADYEGLRAEQARRRNANDPKLMGIGVACYVEITAPMGGKDYGEVRLNDDGSILAVTGSTPYGQGHLTAWAQVISERTGVPMDRIEVRFGDTDIVPEGGITGGSRSAQLAGSAMSNASNQLVEAARKLAADQLEAAVDDVIFDTATGMFHVVGTPAVSVDWQSVAGAAASAELEMTFISDLESQDPTFPFGSHLAVVEVDSETGHVTLERIVAVDDAGTLLNPMLAEGQVHGGLAQGASQALFEEVLFDADGNPLTTNFMDYAIPSATELPSFERHIMTTPTHLNELGAKGIGESGTIGSTPAVHNAVIDAVSHLGVRHIDMPCTPQKVWQAIRG
ncbi:MAG: xanthine dehydrogenase family protein molybdopterin-binding subunit [Acidimicrobiales bacterium]